MLAHRQNARSPTLPALAPKHSSARPAPRCGIHHKRQPRQTHHGGGGFGHRYGRTEVVKSQAYTGCLGSDECQANAVEALGEVREDERPRFAIVLLVSTQRGQPTCDDLTGGVERVKSPLLGCAWSTVDVPDL